MNIDERDHCEKTAVGTKAEYREAGASSTETDEARPVDPLVSLEQIGKRGSMDLIAQMFELFQVEGPKRLESMRSAFARNDAGELAEAAHSVAGSAIYLGASELVTMCRELEGLAAGGSLEDCAPLLESAGDEIHRILDRSAPILEQYFARKTD